MALHTEIAHLRSALEASVKLQSHYARCLNGADGGDRPTFLNAEHWAEYHGREMRRRLLGLWPVQNNAWGDLGEG